MQSLLITSSYLPVLGGLQIVTHTLAKQLLAEGNEVQVVTNCYPRTLTAKENLDSVPVERLLFLWPEAGYLRRLRPDLLAASCFYGPATLLRLNRIFRRFQPNVVNVHFPDLQIPFVLWLRRRFAFRLVVSLHGDEILRWMNDGRRSTNDKRGLGRLRAILQEADGVTACSGWLLGKAVELEPSVAAKGQVIHNGVDMERFQDRTPYRHPHPYILAYGRLTHKKGFDMLLDAFAQVQAMNPELDLILAGAGEEQEALQRQAQRLGLADRVHFFGRATPERIVHLLNGCRFVVLPSREEPFGIVALEALAAGKPLLATRVGGLPEFIVPTSVLSERSGREASECQEVDSQLVEPNIGGVRQGLEVWLQRHNESESWGERNRKRAISYSWDRVVNRYVEVLDPTTSVV